MRDILQTRLLFWKHEWKGLLIWLLFPLIMTIIIMIVISPLQEETKIPIGIVLEDDSILAKELYESIEETPYVRTFILSEREALNKVEKQELDSVFIVRKQYDQNIERGRQHNLIKSYKSDFSFAYAPLKELVISYVYEDLIRSRATYVVRDLQDTYNDYSEWNWYELVERSKEIEREQNLLQTTLIFHDSKDNEATSLLFIDPWTIWILMTFLATFLLFDWVIKENKRSLHQRLSFSKVSFKYYLIGNGLIYTVCLLVIDLITLGILALLFDMSLTFTMVMTIICYRFTLNIFVFLLSLRFQAVYSFYVFSFLLFCIMTLVSGAIIPIDGLISWFPLFIYVNPLEPILSQEIFNYWFIAAIILFSIWFIRKEKHHA